jgi:phage gp36-like protein
MALGGVMPQSYIDGARDEIDGRIGRLYVLPLTPAPAAHVALTLKNCNKFIASGRLIMAQAVGGENGDVHAYGLYLLRQGEEILCRIENGDIELGTKKVEWQSTDSGNAPSIFGQDAMSAVDAFYANTSNTGSSITVALGAVG